MAGRDFRSYQVQSRPWQKAYRVAGKPNALNKRVSRMRVMAPIPVAAVVSTWMEWRRITWPAPRQYSATAGCAFAAVGIIAFSPSVVTAPGNRRGLAGALSANGAVSVVGMAR